MQNKISFSTFLFIFCLNASQLYVVEEQRTMFRNSAAYKRNNDKNLWFWSERPSTSKGRINQVRFIFCGKKLLTCHDILPQKMYRWDSKRSSSFSNWNSLVPLSESKFRSFPTLPFTILGPYIQIDQQHYVL